MTSPIAVSGLFTAGVFGIYPAPKPYRALFFTNREDIGREAARQGWEPCLLEWPTSTDTLGNNLLSKAVKFLEVFDAQRVKDLNINLAEGLLYFDHKFRVDGHHVRKIAEAGRGADVLIRETPRLKTSIWQEVEDAEKQPRYAQAMPQTVEWIREREKDGFRTETRICNTGLIYYTNPDKARALSDAVLKSCIALRQPECQIFWALHMQNTTVRVRRISWSDPAVAGILWRDPAKAKTSAYKRFFSVFSAIHRAFNRPKG